MIFLPMKTNPLRIFQAATLLALFALPLKAAEPPAEHLPANGICGVITEAKAKTRMVDLAKSGKVVVHVLAPSEKSADEIAKAADKAGVGGKLLVESIPASPIPWRPNLLNGLVIENPEGIDLDQALAAVAPGGKLCVLKDGQWEITVRERPDGMDIWTHNYRDAGGNSGVSEDTLVGFPLGLRWNDDLPFNLSTSSESSNQWSNTRAIATVNGRIFYVTNAARENLRRTVNEMRAEKGTQDVYLIARDAWNGTLLWRRKLGDIFYGNLFYTARAPMAALGDKVYAVTKDKMIHEIDGQTGKTLRTFEPKFMPARLMILDGVLVVACWEGGEHTGGATGIIRRPLDADVEKGSVVAFDLSTGKKAWEHDRLATSLRGADGRIYIVERDGADQFEIDGLMRAKRRGQYADYDAKQPEKMKEKYGDLPGRGSQKVVAFNVTDGEKLWELDGAALELDPVDHLAISVAGLDDVVVTKNTHAITRAGSREAIILEGGSGRTVLRRATNSFPVLHDDKIHIDGTAFDPLTGSHVEGKGIRVGLTVCTPQVYVNGITTNNRSNSYNVEGETRTFGAARGSCMFAAVPANGAFYTAQTYCACAPGTVPGFISFGPIGTEPTEDEVIAGAKLIKGPAFGKQGDGEDSGGGWSTYLGNGDRSNSHNGVTLPAGELSIAWKKQIAAPFSDSNIESSWKDSLEGLLTAPIASDGLVIAADRHRRKVIALNATDGSVAWEKFVGGRLTAPPTLTDDLCLFGANDGYVYALNAKDGTLAWKLRMGPEERRMVAYAQPESPWPVYSSILVSDDGTAYASAGRSTGAESGIIVRAFDPKTGEIQWSTPIAYREGRRAEHVNDVMYLHEGKIHLMKSVLDPKTGEFLPNPRDEHAAKIAAWKKALAAAALAGEEAPPQPELPKGLAMHNLGIEGIANSNWTKLGDRRRRFSTFDEVIGTILAWDDSVILGAAPGRNSVYSRTERNETDGKPKFLWNSPLPDEQVTAVAIGKNAVVLAGGLYPEDGKSLGFVRIVDRETGKPTGSLEFPAPLSYHGLAIADGKIFATFEDGTAVCIGSL